MSALGPSKGSKSLRTCGCVLRDIGHYSKCEVNKWFGYARRFSNGFGQKLKPLFQSNDGALFNVAQRLIVVDNWDVDLDFMVNIFPPCRGRSLFDRDGYSCPIHCRPITRSVKPSNSNSGNSSVFNSQFHQAIPFVRLWNTAKGAGNRGGKQAPVVCENTAGRGTPSVAFADWGQARLQVAPKTSLLNLGRVGADRAARPAFLGVFHG